MNPTLKQSLNNTASNYNQPERRLTPSGRSAVVESFRNGSGGKFQSSKTYNLLVSNLKPDVP